MKVVNEGEAVVRMKAVTDEDSDAMEMRFPVFVHGMLKMESFTGVIRPDKDDGKVVFSVPAERRVNESVLEVRYSPTLAGAMIDALPYLVDYPYGCTEQTLNRFLPTVITQRLLAEHEARPEGDREAQTNLNAGEIGDDGKRVKDWKRLTKRNPVFDEDEVRHMSQAGVNALAACRSPTAAGVGSPATANAVGRTPPPSSSTACKWPRRTMSPCRPTCSNAASNGSRTTSPSRSACCTTPPPRRMP